LWKLRLPFVDKLQARFFFVQGIVQRLGFVLDYLIYVTAITKDTTAITKPATPIPPTIAVFVSAMNQSRSLV